VLEGREGLLGMPALLGQGRPQEIVALGVAGVQPQRRPRGLGRIGVPAQLDQHVREELVVLVVVGRGPDRRPDGGQRRLGAAGLLVGDAEQEVGLGVLGPAVHRTEEEIDGVVEAAQVDELLRQVEGVSGRHLMAIVCTQRSKHQRRPPRARRPSRWPGAGSRGCPPL
jgi:hypothetical protein